MSAIAKRPEQDGAKEGYGVHVACSGMLSAPRTKHAISHTQLQLQQKILKLSEQLKMEQSARHDNVVEYLKLVNSNSNKQQRSCIKQAFEKTNQTSAQTIHLLQRRLEHCHCKLRMVEHDAGMPRHPKDVFQDMHRSLRDVGAKVSTFSHSAAGAVVSKRREIASLIRKRFTRAECPHCSKDDCTSAAFGSVGASSTTEAPGGPPRSKGNSVSSDFDAMLCEVQKLRDNQCRLEVAFENQKSHFERDYTLMLEAIQEDRHRCENDIKVEKENHSLKNENEIHNLKQDLGSLEKQLDDVKQELAGVEEKMDNQCNVQARVNRKASEASERLKRQHQKQALQLETLENNTLWNSLGSKMLLAVLYLLAFVYWAVVGVKAAVVWVKGRKPLTVRTARSRAAISTLLVLVTFTLCWNYSDAVSHVSEFHCYPGWLS